MIDLDWLETLQFTTAGGRVTGLAGIGSQWIVFNFEPAEEDPRFGKEIVLKILNEPRLGWHIREIPPDLELRPSYDALRVNRKLCAQVGNSLFDSMVGAYNDLYECLIEVLHKDGVQAIRSMIDDKDSGAFFTFLLRTPAFRRRLEDIAVLDTSGDAREVVMLNGVLHTIEESRGAASAWARSMIQVLDGIPDLAGAAPAKLCENPFWIWGGAVLDGFFTLEEMADAAAFIAAHFGDPGGSADAHRLRFEMFAFLSMLSLVAKRDKLQRLTDFCNCAGLGFVLPDPEAEQPDEPEKPPDEAVVGRMPNMSPPSTAPRFPEEFWVDPLAQDPKLLADAGEIVRKFATRISAAAHAAGIAVMLPHAESESDPHSKPWRCVVRVQKSENSPENSAEADEDECPALLLIQRLLVTAQAISARRNSISVPEGMARLIEVIGYVAIGHSHDFRSSPRLNSYRSMGRMAAALHRAGYVHGDLQPENFTFEPDGEVASMFDLGRTHNPARPLTALERASDLTVLKKRSSFLE